MASGEDSGIGNSESMLSDAREERLRILALVILWTLHDKNNLFISTAFSPRFMFKCNAIKHFPFDQSIFFLLCGNEEGWHFVYDTAYFSLFSFNYS
jgi:hypothetical protein